jgi:cytochrome c551/c552
MKKLIFLMAALASSASAAFAADPPGLAAAKQNACVACHGITNKVVGPGFTQIAAKYKDTADAEAVLFGKLKTGSSGTWGPVPMPSQAHVKDEELKTILSWIMAGAK